MESDFLIGPGGEVGVDFRVELLLSVLLEVVDFSDVLHVPKYNIRLALIHASTVTLFRKQVTFSSRRPLPKSPATEFGRILYTAQLRPSSSTFEVSLDRSYVRISNADDQCRVGAQSPPNRSGGLMIDRRVEFGNMKYRRFSMVYGRRHYRFIIGVGAERN